MKAITVQQPWAWAIIYGGKDVENRTQAWKYRGPLAIHAGGRWSHRGARSGLIWTALSDGGWTAGPANLRDSMHGDKTFSFGAIIGVVDLDDAHPANPECCDSPWAETEYVEHGGRTRRQLVHLILANPRPLAVPVLAKGALGLWEIPDGLVTP